MNVAVFAYSRQGCETARRVIECFPDALCRAYTMGRFQTKDFLPLRKPSEPFYGECFAWADAMIFVSSCGIAVREIAPHVKDKTADPAVLCMDERATFVIPLLSGHIGGANALAAQLAAQLGAIPVITTATDVNRRFSVDTWAAEQNIIISDMKMAKAISAAILEKDVGICSDFPVVTDYPAGTFPAESGEIGICISCMEKSPFQNTLRLIPPILHLGIGCRKGITPEAIASAVETVLQEHGIDRRAVKCAASIDIKQEERGLLEFCERSGLPICFYPAETLREIEGDFTSSRFVESITGIDNVCERAALLGAEKLWIRKTAINGVTVAIAAEKLEVHFG